MLGLIASAALGAVFGGILTILITVFVEYLRSPSLGLSLGEEPRDHPYPEGKPARVMRSLTVKLSNKALWGPRWMTRAPALQCRATITFHHLDGQDVFGRAMEGRWCESAQPAGMEGAGEIVRTNERQESDRIIFRIIDPMRVTLKSRIDVYPGESELLDIAVRLDDDEPCYGWNNETYFCETPWRNPKWKLERGRYLVRVTVVSSGQKCVGTFRLINDVTRSDFRLEASRPEDNLKLG
jgi:hypothetical protein